MKFAFIAPRYGAEIVAGAEHACRLWAEKLSARHDIEVLTTCGRNPSTWSNEYTEGSDRIRGVLVRRFAVSQAHDPDAFRELSHRLLEGGHTRADELEWVRRLGPFAPGLVEHLKRHHRSYDALVFFSLYHPTTVHGVQVAPERSVLFPHLRLDPALRCGLWKELLSSVRAVGLLSTAERQLLRNYLHVAPAVEEIVGVGVESPPPQTYPQHQRNPADAVTDEEEAAGVEPTADTEYLSGRGVLFRRRHRLYGQFALYAGRVEPDNGCEELLEYFNSYAETGGHTALVLMGPKMMKIPDERHVRLAGILSDRERVAAYEAADVTLVPDSDDLLVQPLLESFAVGTPVLASARNQAAVEHCRRAGAGLYYADRGEFVEALRILMTDTRLRQRMADSGRRYISQHFRWDAVLGRFERLVALLKRDRGDARNAEHTQGHSVLA